MTDVGGGALFWEIDAGICMLEGAAGAIGSVTGGIVFWVSSFGIGVWVPIDLLPPWEVHLLALLQNRVDFVFGSKQWYRVLD